MPDEEASVYVSARIHLSFFIIVVLSHGVGGVASAFCFRVYNVYFL